MTKQENGDRCFDATDCSSSENPYSAWPEEMSPEQASWHELKQNLLTILFVGLVMYGACRFAIDCGVIVQKPGVRDKFWFEDELRKWILER